MFLFGLYQTHFGWFASVLATWALCFVAAADFLSWRVRGGLLLYGIVTWTLPEVLVPEGYARGEPLPAWWYVVAAGTLAVGAAAVSLL